MNIFLFLYSIDDYIIGVFPTAVQVEYFGADVTYKIPTDGIRNLSKVFNHLEKGSFKRIELLVLFIFYLFSS